MTERLPDTGEDPWQEIMGARDTSGGFLRVAHNDDGTLQPIVTGNGAPTGWEISSAGTLSITGAGPGGPQIQVVATAVTGDATANIFMPHGIFTIHQAGVDITKNVADSNPVFQAFTNVNDGTSLAEFGTFDGNIRIASQGAWLVFQNTGTPPTTGDLSNHECAMWYDESGPSINFLAKTGETAQIVLT